MDRVVMAVVGRFGRGGRRRKEVGELYLAMAKAQPRDPSTGKLLNASDAFVTWGCGRGHWIGVKKSGELVT